MLCVGWQGDEKENRETKEKEAGENYVNDAKMRQIILNECIVVKIRGK